MHIQNVVLIDKLNLDIQNGLHVLTGETGAGKSIILDALNLILGERADPHIIRLGAEQAIVTGEFCVEHFEKDHPLFKILGDMDMQNHESLLIKRTIQNQKSRCFINDQPVSLQTLRTIGQNLIEIHNQLDYSFSPSKQRQLLDTFSSTRMKEFKQTLLKTQEAFQVWQESKGALLQIEKSIEENTTKAFFINQLMKELSPLHLQPHEEDQLLSEREAFANFGKAQKILQDALHALKSPQPTVNTLFTAARNLGRCIDIVPEYLKQTIQHIDHLGTELQEALTSIESYLREHQDSTKRLQEIDERLYLLRSISKKYAVPANDLYAHLQNAQNQINHLSNSEDDLLRLQKACAMAKEQYLTVSKQLHTLRAQGAQQLSKLIMDQLPDLKMPHAMFQVKVEATEQYSIFGLDNIHFEVRMNPGQTFSPIEKTASGGELARLKLVLRVILADAKSIPCVVFDEIDQGVSGSVATAIGQKLKRLSKYVQVICITHSPQVAAFADHHYKVSKEAFKESVITRIQKLESHECIDEIAKLLSGGQNSKAATMTATELIEKSSA